MKLLKDLLYTRNNEALDISRFCSLLAVLTYLGCALAKCVADPKAFDLVEFGTGFAAVAAGGGAWIYARQRYEQQGDPA